ncbi:hypothetical protein T07_945 [Trichinella nelsoni]|uniref:Uncharacterized protein n=1 Tax=Trichinella nelsoni TaxID=6336 RepID=A0A0V0SCK4_9BILA|nr:hypothetical protein T07_945 [Trichinella nelsoni]
MHFQGLSLRLAVARTEKQLKQSFQVVSRWKEVYNENPVEFIPEEGKTRRCIPLKINRMFSITPGNISLVSVCQTEREATDFIHLCITHLFIISFHILVEEWVPRRHEAELRNKVYLVIYYIILG